MSNSIDIGFRWIDDISVELTDGVSSENVQLKIYADVIKKYAIKKSGENRRILRPGVIERIPCDKKDEIIIELFQSKRKYGLSKRKEQISSVKIPLAKEELYTVVMTQSDDNKASVTLTFAYTPGGALRDRVEDARRITEDQKVVLDRIRHVHRFFEGLEVVCSAVEDLHPYIKIASTAILSLYRICERQKKCRDAAQGLVEEMEELLSYGVEKLSDVLMTNSDTKAAFKSITEAIGEFVKYIEEQNKGMAGSLLRDTVSSSYKTKLEELHAKFKKAKEGLRDSISAGTWRRVVNADLERKLKSVSSAHYQPGARCLPNTRVVLLDEVDMWLRGFSDEKMAWIYGYAGSGKSALLNSIAKNLENTRIPFSYFTCKRDNAEQSDVQRILPTICYDLTQFYGDYQGYISDVVDQPAGRSISTGDIASQSELLFGESPAFKVISHPGARRPPVHVILIDALDECQNVRQRSALARFLRTLANSVPWIKVVITSRREPDIVDVLGNGSDVHRIDINSGEWKAEDDIRVFVAAEMKRLRLDHLSELETLLVERASGLFIWCTTLFRYIEDSGDKETVLRSVLDSSSSSSSLGDEPLAPIYDLYRHVISSAVPPGHKSDSELMHRILGLVLLAASRRPISILAMSELLNLKDKHTWVATITRRLHAILYEDPSMSGAIRVCHPSVLDFLSMQFEGNEYSVTLASIHALLFKNNLCILNRDLRFNICDLRDSSQFNKDVADLDTRISQNMSEAFQYGCLFWLSHLEQSGSKESNEDVYNFLNSLKALYWIEALSLLNVVDRGILLLQDCARFFEGQGSMPEIANEWERFLLAYGDALQSTPHLYLSALPWIPETSRLRSIVSSYFSSSSKMIANVAEVWGGQRWSENVGTGVTSVTYSPDGRLFAAGCLDGSVRFWEARSAKREKKLFKADQAVRAIAFSRDTRWLASGHKDGCIRLWDFRADSGSPLRILLGHTKVILALAFSTDGKRIVSGPGDTDKSIKIWDVESGREVVWTHFMNHDSSVTSVEFSADDKWVISSSWDGTVLIRESDTGKNVGMLRHPDIACPAACSRDGKYVATSSFDQAIRLWGIPTFEQLGEPMKGHTGSITSVCFSPDSKYVASASNDLSIRVWGVETRALVCELRGHMGQTFSVTFSPDGRSLLSGSYDSSVRLWDLNVTDQSYSGQSVGAVCVCYTSDGNAIVSGSNDGNIYFRDVRTGDIIGKPLTGHRAAVKEVAVSNNGRWLASWSFDYSFRIWDVDTDTTTGQSILSHDETVYSLVFSPDSRSVASASDDKIVRLWDVATCEVVTTLEGHEDCVNAVVFSVDGRWIISGSSDCTIRIWDTQTGQSVGEPLRGHEGSVYALAVSPDGQWIASGSSDKTVRIWNASISSSFSEVHLLEGHSGYVTTLAFSSDSAYLISGSWDGTVRVWNARTGKAVGDPLRGYTDRVEFVKLSPKGDEIMSCSLDEVIRFWDIRSRLDLDLYSNSNNISDSGGKDYHELSDEELSITWNACRARLSGDDGWVRDGQKLLLWVPLQYRHDVGGGTRLVIGAHVKERVRPEVDFRRLFRYGGVRWRDVYTGLTRMGVCTCTLVHRG